MSRVRGTKWHCNCIICESIQNGAIDLRKGQYLLNNFEPRKCELCLIIRTKEELAREDKYYGWVKKSVFIPNSVKDFLGMEYLCDKCLHSIDFKMRRELKQCWSKVNSEVVKLAIVMLIREELSSLASTEFRQKSWLTKAIKNNHDYSTWPWVTQEMINESLQRIGTN